MDDSDTATIELAPRERGRSPTRSRTTRSMPAARTNGAEGLGPPRAGVRRRRRAVRGRQQVSSRSSWRRSTSTAGPQPRDRVDPGRGSRGRPGPRRPRRRVGVDRGSDDREPPGAVRGDVRSRERDAIGVPRPDAVARSRLEFASDRPSFPSHGTGSSRPFPPETDVRV